MDIIILKFGIASARSKVNKTNDVRMTHLCHVKPEINHCIIKTSLDEKYC